MPNELVEYIGRPSILGNPFPMYREDQRDTVIAQYKNWLQTEYAKRRKVWVELRRLAEHVHNGTTWPCNVGVRRAHVTAT